MDIGRQGERLLLKRWPNPIRRRYEDLKGVDFEDSYGTLIELKTDTHDPSETANFFIERWSDVESKRPGGPWQALGKGAQLLIYLYLFKDKDGKQQEKWYRLIGLESLTRRIEDAKMNLKVVQIPNKGWTTEGYLVPREFVKDLAREGLED
jgi:hypothetical protein